MSIRKRESMSAEVLAAIDTLEGAGFTVHTRRAEEETLKRIWSAESRLDWETQRREHAEEWARESLNLERRLRDRLTVVWGVAAKHGATLDEIQVDMPDLPEL